jgi:hypothetical protein
MGCTIKERSTPAAAASVRNCSAVLSSSCCETGENVRNEVARLGRLSLSIPLPHLPALLQAGRCALALGVGERSLARRPDVVVGVDEPIGKSALAATATAARY